jgi:hypothetical protein
MTLPAVAWQAPIFDAPELDAGFRLLYELKPQEARAKFSVWQAAHPEDPLGSAAEAASYLFEECYRQGVLTSKYFLDDNRFLGKIPIKPDPDVRDAFFAANVRTRYLAAIRLDSDVNALFAMTLSLGMQADYASLIDKDQIESLRMIGEADKFAKKLLAINPAAADAYVTLGAANYVLGSMPAMKRLYLHFKGVKGDKVKGIQQLELAAARGHYLRPFAKVLLAMAALREKDFERARVQLAELVEEFPKNPLFLKELSEVDALRSAATHPPR